MKRKEKANIAKLKDEQSRQKNWLLFKNSLWKQLSQLFQSVGERNEEV